MIKDVIIHGGPVSECRRFPEPGFLGVAGEMGFHDSGPLPDLVGRELAPIAYPEIHRTARGISVLSRTSGGKEGFLPPHFLQFLFGGGNDLAFKRIQ